MNLCVYGASSDAIDPEYLAGGEELGRCLARHGCGLVFGGGAHGMMGAASRGAHEIGGVDIIGIAPSFFHVDGVLSPYCTELISTETMRERKGLMEEKSSGFIITPGGIGTLDEFFEIFTLRQLGRHGKPIAILNLKGYFDDVERMLKKAAKEHFMKKETLNLVQFFQEPEKLVCWIEEQEEQLEAIESVKYLR